MSALTRSLSTRIVKKLEKPKPLKVVPGHVYESHIKQHQAYESSDIVIKSEAAIDQLQDTFRILDLVSEAIQKNDQSNISQLTNELVQRLRNHGSQLEENCLGSEKLEKIFEVLRSGINEISLDPQSRLNLLQIVELRASRWQPPLGFFSYYNKRSPLQQEFGEPSGEALSDNEQQYLGPGEVLKSSGKYGCPLKIPGKNYCKDEVVIRNSDSGKVMGIKGRRVHMIEELSETVISFQRVNPGAKERLVQITGPNETKIMMARQLIEDTIKRNASPVREVNIVGTREVGGSNSSINSSASDESSRLLGPTVSVGKPVCLSATEYKYSVRINEDVINISSTNLELLNDAKILLDSTYVDKSAENNNNEVKQTRSDFNNSFSNCNSNSIQEPQGMISNDILSNSEIGCVNESEKSPESVTESVHSLLARNNSIVTGMKKEYSRQFLLDCSTSKASLMKPHNWDYVVNTYPAIVKEVVEGYSNNCFTFYFGDT
ncbi:unnamed protein product [Nezara viridula]|uniref:K Homology domain-containing protein n=1 Tax=Nezara viridula TaxID=85310 RepID=A0A9P0GV47_NEZVI|nr:unnamed protein product [Nezara viridula]